MKSSGKSKSKGVFKKIKAEMERQYGIKNEATTLYFCSLGAAMISEFPYSFIIDNVGNGSSKGLCVAISGDAVASGRMTAGEISLTYYDKGHKTIVKKPFSSVEKKDGKRILQAKFSPMNIESGRKLSGSDEEIFEKKLKNQLCFTFIPKFSGDEDEEVMLTVYPYENVLEGAANKWRYVCADASSLEKYLK